MIVMFMVAMVVMFLMMHDRYILLFCVVHRLVDMHWRVVFNFNWSWVMDWDMNGIWNMFDNWYMNGFLHWHWDVVWYFYFICSN